MALRLELAVSRRRSRRDATSVLLLVEGAHETDCILVLLAYSLLLPHVLSGLALFVIDFISNNGNFGVDMRDHTLAIDASFTSWWPRWAHFDEAVQSIGGRAGTFLRSEAAILVFVCLSIFLLYYDEFLQLFLISLDALRKNGRPVEVGLDHTISAFSGGALGHALLQVLIGVSGGWIAPTVGHHGVL